MLAAQALGIIGHCQNNLDRRPTKLSALAGIPSHVLACNCIKTRAARGLHNALLVGLGIVAAPGLKVSRRFIGNCQVGRLNVLNPMVW